jgi:hypothetical protein
VRGREARRGWRKLGLAGGRSGQRLLMLLALARDSMGLFERKDQRAGRTINHEAPDFPESS